MDQSSNRRHRFPPPIIQHAIWLYLRFTLSYRDVEDILAERGLEVSVRNGAALGAEFRAWVCPQASTVPSTPERPMAPRRDGGPDRRPANVPVARRRSRGEVLDMLVHHRRDKRAALRLMRKLLKKQGFVPKLLTTDKLG